MRRVRAFRWCSTTLVTAIAAKTQSTSTNPRKIRVGIVKRGRRAIRGIVAAGSPPAEDLPGLLGERGVGLGRLPGRRPRFVAAAERHVGAGPREVDEPRLLVA